MAFLFQTALMDKLYGRKAALRRDLEQAGVEYYADVPATTVVYLDKLQFIYTHD